MRILIVSDGYPPEIRSASHLMKELAEELRDRGHSVLVATCYPEYNLVDADRQRTFDEYSDEEGIDVLRIHTPPHHKVHFVIRGISQLTLPYLFLRKIRQHNRRKIDVVIVYSPALPLWKVGDRIKKRHGARFLLNLQDIFPQNAIDLGVLKNPILVRFFERMEQKAYSRADVVTVHSDGNGAFLRSTKKLDDRKLTTVHNWIQIDQYREPWKNATWRRKLGLEGKFVFFFGGVVGPAQGLDLVVEAANELKDVQDIMFLIAGDGMEKERLVNKSKELGLTNIQFIPFVSKQDYDELVAEANVGLVSLSSKNKTPVVPGKILGYMAAGIPVFAILNRESDGHSIISSAHCGSSVFSEDKAQAVAAIRNLHGSRDQLKTLGANGFNFAQQHFSKKVCIDKLERLMHP